MRNSAFKRKSETDKLASVSVIDKKIQKNLGDAITKNHDSAMRVLNNWIKKDSKKNPFGMGF